jgi:hypothetical protein
MGQLNSVHIFTTRFCNIHFNIIPPSMHRSTSCLSAVCRISHARCLYCVPTDRLMQLIPRPRLCLYVYMYTHHATSRSVVTVSQHEDDGDGSDDRAAAVSRYRGIAPQQLSRTWAAPCWFLFLTRHTNTHTPSRCSTYMSARTSSVVRMTRHSVHFDFTCLLSAELNTRTFLELQWCKYRDNVKIQVWNLARLSEGSTLFQDLWECNAVVDVWCPDRPSNRGMKKTVRLKYSCCVLFTEYYRGD